MVNQINSGDGGLKFNLFNTPYTISGRIDQPSEIKNPCPDFEKLSRKRKKTLDKIK